MATSGNGSSLGAALIDLAGKLRRGGRAVGWHARLRRLTASSTGYAALAAAGVSVTARTLVAWLAEDRAPSKANQERIAEAWGLYGMGRLSGGEAAITGIVKIGNDVRYRGQPPHAPFRVDHRAGLWGRLGDLLSVSAPDADDVEQAYIEDVILEDMDFSDPPEFPGDSYTIDM